MPMDLKARKEALIKDLQELMNKVLQFQGAIAMLDEILKKEETDAAVDKATANTPTGEGEQY